MGDASSREEIPPAEQFSIHNVQCSCGRNLKVHWISPYDPSTLMPTALDCRACKNAYVYYPHKAELVQVVSLKVKPKVLV